MIFNKMSRENRSYYAVRFINRGFINRCLLYYQLVNTQPLSVVKASGFNGLYLSVAVLSGVNCGFDYFNSRRSRSVVVSSLCLIFARESQSIKPRTKSVTRSVL